MSIDLELLSRLIVAFELGDDILAGPFDMNTGVLDPAVVRVVDAFLTGSAVPDTLEHMPPMPDEFRNQATATAIAGFLQGLAIGHAYATEEGRPA